ncbi:MAG: endolytic transglycosylase MltG [Patescibacteria group bacterium]
MDQLNFKIAPALYVLLFFVIVFSFFHLLLSAPREFPSGKIITIDQGANLRTLSRDLKTQNVIRSRFVFESFVIFYGGEKKISPGDYVFDKKIAVYNVADKIVKKDRGISQVKVTIPEGFDNNDIASLFSSKLIKFDKVVFLNQAKDKQGYLFPDTYFFFPTDDAGDVFKVLSNNFIEKTKNLNKDIVNSGRSEKEIIVMASIIEREAKGDADRAIISGILWNRIKKGMPLQVDAAPETYKTRGLPKSPICNPGLESIYSSIYPSNSNYFYYLHDKQGGIHYARTFEEHKLNKQKYLR